VRVRVSYVVDADDDTRRAIRKYHGEEGLATRDEVKQWYELYGSSMNDDMSSILDGDEGEE
jgi:hypothetical protein